MKTKRKMICSALVALLFVTNVYGAPGEYDYDKLSDKMKFGAKLKWNGSFIVCTTDRETRHGELEAERSDLITGYSFDLFGEYALSDAVKIQLSLGYSRQGGSYSLSSKKAS